MKKINESELGYTLQGNGYVDVMTLLPNDDYVQLKKLADSNCMSVEAYATMILKEKCKHFAVNM